MTTILCIDTASPEFAVVLHRDGQVARSIVRAAGYDHSRLLVPAIAEVAEGARPDAIAVVRGPGSYAGIRVGMATASGMAMARGIPVIGVATLEAVAEAAGPGSWLAVHPAGRETLAMQEYLDGEAAGPLAASALPLEANHRTAGEVEDAYLFVGLLARCSAAARLASARFAAGGDDLATEALYLREPNITVSRRAPRATVTN